MKKFLSKEAENHLLFLEKTIVGNMENHRECTLEKAQGRREQSFLGKTRHTWGKKKIELENVVSFELKLSDEKKEKKEAIPCILVAEHDLPVRIKMNRLLADESVFVIFAQDGQEAAMLYKEKKPDLVFIDILLPVMNGFETLDAIKNNEKKVSPIVACTKRVLPTEKDYLLSYGFDDYLEKPIDEKRVKEIIQLYLKKG